jgi:hypothetical protein
VVVVVLLLLLLLLLLLRLLLFVRFTHTRASGPRAPCSRHHQPLTTTQTNNRTRRAARHVSQGGC